MFPLRSKLQGVLPILSEAMREFPATAFTGLNRRGSFDCALVHFVNERFAQDDILLTTGHCTSYRGSSVISCFFFFSTLSGVNAKLKVRPAYQAGHWSM